MVLVWSDHLRWQKVISTNEIVENSTFPARFYVETYKVYSYSKCMSCFLFQCYPAVYLTMNDYFRVYVLEFQTIFPCVFETIWMCFAVARVWKSVDQWTFSVCKDVPQQKPRTSGEFRNLECVSDLLSFRRDIPSPKTRTWARQILSTSKVEDVKFEALAMQQREPLIISFSFWESETCQGTIDLQHLAHCISSNSGWQ